MIEDKKPFLVEVEGNRDIVLEKLGTLKQLADDLGVSVVSQTIRFRCDNPECNFRIAIMPDQVYDIKFCPRCGVKEGTFPFKAD